MNLFLDLFRNSIQITSCDKCVTPEWTTERWNFWKCKNKILVEQHMCISITTKQLPFASECIYCLLFSHVNLCVSDRFLTAQGKYECLRIDNKRDRRSKSPLFVESYFFLFQWITLRSSCIDFSSIQFRQVKNKYVFSCLSLASA